MKKLSTVSGGNTATAAYITTCLYWCSIYVYVPILGTYCEMMDISYTMIGTILSSYGLVQLIMRIPIGVVSDRMGKKKPFMIFGMCCSVISGLIFFLADSAIMMLLGRSLAGLSAATWAIFMVNYCSYLPVDLQSKGMGTIGTTTYLGQVVATVAGGIIASVFSERLTFIISSITAIIGMSLVFILPDAKRTSEPSPKLSDFLMMLRNPDLIYFSLLAVVMQIAVYSGVLGFVPNILKNLGGSNIILGLGSAFASLLGIVTSLLSGTFFERRVGYKPSIFISFLLVSLMLVLTGLTESIPLILLFTLITSGPRGLIQTMLNSLAIRGIEPQLRSAAASVFQSIYGLGMTIGPALTGLVADLYGVKTAFIVVGAFTLMAASVVLFRNRWPEWVE
ncbi:MAG: MFS transporter [Oscillospiraceae bacterium]|nr:MFS transporter [Oscillospiraceae bacterium]